MRILFLFLLSIVAFIAPLQRIAAQQQYPVQIQPAVSFPSTLLNDYGDPANTSIRVYLADMTKLNYAINIRVALTGPGVSYKSINGINVTLDGGQVYFLNASELSKLFALTDLTATATAQNNEPNSLPEGGYSLAIEAFDANLLPSIIVPVSNIRTDFTLFNVVRYDPPLLNSPADKQEFDLQTTNQNIFFNWTPRHIVYSPSQEIQYRYRMIRVIPVDRNPYDAVNTSLAGATGNIDVNALDFATFIYSPTDLQLIPGSVYAWQVQAYETINGVVSTSRFKNQGFSEVFTFSVKEHCTQITLAPPVVSSTSVRFTWNPGDTDSDYNEYEFNYRALGSATGWIPISTTTNSIELTDTVLQRGIPYEYNVRARCNNWIPPVQGGNFMLATPTCVAPTPITVNTTGSTTLLSWPKATGVDSLKLYYKKTGTTDPYSTLSLNPGDVQCSIPLLTSGGYTIHLDAFCGTGQTAGVENSFDYNENGVVGPCPIPLPFQLIATRFKGDTASLKWTTIDGVHKGSNITYWHKDSSTVTYKYNSITTAEGTGASGIHIYDDQLYNYKIEYLCGTKSQTTPIGMFRILSASAKVNIDPPTASCFPPVDIRAEARDSVTARVEWDKISGAENYELSYRIKGSTLPFTPFNTTATNATLKPLEKNVQYQLLVRVKCGGIYSIYSDTALVDLTIPRNRNCDTATFFKALKKTTNNIQTAWNFDSTCTGYIIKYREEAQPLASEYTQAFTNIDTLKRYNVVRDTARYTFQNLKSGTRYVFRIQKICGQNNALFNLPLIATTLADAKSSGACGSGNVCNKDSTDKLQSLIVGDTIYCADYQVVVDSVTTATSNPSMGIYSGLGHMEMPVPGLGDFVNMHVSFKNVKINDKPNSCVYAGVINIDSMNASIIPTTIRDSIKALMAKAEGAIDQANAALAKAQGLIDELQTGLQDGIDYFQGGDGVGNVVTGKLGDQPINTNIPLPPPTAGVSGTTVTVGGVSTAVTAFPALLKDTDGEVFQVTSTGQLTYVGKYDTTFAKDTTLDLSDQIVTYTEFAGTPKATYDFDAWSSLYTPSEQINREYEKIGSAYYVPAKFIVPGALDKVTATINTSNSDAQKVVFSNGKGFVYAAERNGKVFTLNLAGGPASDGQYIYAWYVDGNDRKAIGKLLLPSYAPKTKNVVLVPVKGTQTFNPATYESYLNETYQKIGITYHVTLDNSFRTNTDWAPDGNLTVQSTSSNLLSNDYQGKERAIVEAYVAFKGGAANIDPNTAYFMVVYEPARIESNLLGKMPAEEQFGFLYSGNFSASGSAQDNGLKRTIAHELGHGAYHMEHIFNSIYLGAGPDSANVKASPNLMSYNNTYTANELWKFQWDIVHDPGHVWGILKRDRDAQMIGSNYVDLSNETNFLNADGNTITYLCPNGQYITLPKTYKVNFNSIPTTVDELGTQFIYGSLMGFKTTKGNEYIISYDDDANFLSYNFVINKENGGTYKNEDLSISTITKYSSNTVFPTTDYGLTHPIEKLVYYRWNSTSTELVVYNAQGIDLKYYNNSLNEGKLDDYLFYDKIKNYFLPAKLLSTKQLIDQSLSEPILLEKIKYICDKYKDKPEIVLAQKIGLWSIKCNDLFKVFTNDNRFLIWENLQLIISQKRSGQIYQLTNVGIWEKYIIDNEQYYDFWINNNHKDFLIEFLNKIDELYKDRFSLINSLTINSTANQALDALSVLSIWDLKTVDFDKRIQVLKILSLNAGYTAVKEATLFTFRSFSNSEWPKLLDSLVLAKNRSNQNLFVTLIKNNAEASLIQYILKRCATYYDANDIDVSNDKIYYWHVYKDNPTSTCISEGPTGLNVQNYNDVSLELSQIYTFDSNCLPNIEHRAVSNDIKSYNVFDPVGFVFNSAPDQTLCKGCVTNKLYIVPAFFVELYTSGRWNQILTESAQDVIEYTLFAYGLSEYQSANAFFKALIAIDGVVTYTNSIISNPSIRQKINSTPEGKIFLWYWAQAERANTYLQFSPLASYFYRGAVDKFKAWSSIRSNVDNLGSEGITLETKIDDIERNLFGNGSQVPGGLLSKINELNLTNLKNAISRLDETTKAKFLNEFQDAGEDVLRALDSETDLIDVWKKVTYLTNEAKDVKFLQALKKVEADDVWKHIVGEAYSTSSAAGGHILTNINKVNIGGEYWIYSDKIRFKVSDIQLPNPWSEGMEIMKAKKIKIFDGSQWVNKNGAGVSSFFPSTWSKQRILEETALAFKKAKADPNTYWDAASNGNTYYVFATDGQTKITLFCGANGSINPLLNPADNPIIKSSFPKF